MILHPIIQNELNLEQQKAVRQMENCVVAAGAGSGKTRVLAYRYAHLVIEHDFSVDSILTLTFTKKATAEMFDRIYKTLKTISVSKDSTQEQKERARRAIEDFHTSRIQTLDSYCSTIVRGASKQYGIRPDFVIDDENIKEYCKQLAMEYMLKYRNNSAMKDLVGNDKFENATEALFVNPIMYYSNIAQEIDFTGFIQGQIDIVLKEWEKCIDSLFFVKDVIIHYKEDTADFYEHIERKLIDEKEIKSYINDVKNKTCTSSYIEKEKKAIIDFLHSCYTLTKIPKPRGKDSDEIKIAIDTIRNTYKTLTSLAQYILYFSQTLELLPILQKFQSEITEWKRSTGILSFSDVSSLALKTLIEYPEIRKNEKEKISAIMIDEFQDNNAMQKDMLFLLAEKIERTQKTIPTAEEICTDKLFFVGDEKQSIYKFRGADVSVFRELKNDLKHTLTLSTNYRSHPELIAGFNTIFGGYEYKGARASYDEEYKALQLPNSSSVFLQDFQLEKEVSLPNFEAEYTDIFSKKPEKTDENEINKKRIHICLLNNTKQDTDNDDNENEEVDDRNIKEDFVEAENLAIYTADKIAELCTETYKPKDIAILFRSYSKQSMYEKHLRRKGIPYVTENITNFFGDAPINDILSFIRLLVYPMDTMSFAVFLRSPFVRLTHQESISCILNGMNNMNSTLFSEVCSKDLQGDSKKRFSDAMCMYENLKEKAHNASCAQIVYDLWYSFGYRYETMWNKNVTLFSELYEFLFDVARKIDTDGNSLSYFVDYLYELDKNDDRLNDMNIPLEREGAVQLMSIHKSKGLEFPVVFIAGSTSIGKATYNSDKIYVDKSFGPSINFPELSTILDGKGNYFYNFSKNLENKMSEAELRRVLYVAMTRAEKELYITGSFTINKKVLKEIEKNGIVTDFSLCKSDDEKEHLLFDILKFRFESAIKDRKNKINNSQVQYDYCIQNNTLFAFLLPIISYYKNKEAPFLIHLIDTVTREEILSMTDYTKIEQLSHIQERTTPQYKAARKITTPILESPYRSPSQLALSLDIELSKNDNFDSGERAIYELDKIIKSKKSDKFDYSHFGTIAHAYVESLFTNQNPTIPSSILNVLTDVELQTICLIAYKMAENFSNSNIGKEALSSNWSKVEHDFKLLVKKTEEKRVIIKGLIDLLYEREDGKIIIVDYKTDSLENPLHHVPQLAAYRRAVAKIYNKAQDDVMCILFYLRTGNTVDVTQETETIQLEEILFDKES